MEMGRLRASLPALLLLRVLVTCHGSTSWTWADSADYLTNNITTGQTDPCCTPASSADDCAAVCAATSSCTAFVYYPLTAVACPGGCFPKTWLNPDDQLSSTLGTVTAGLLGFGGACMHTLHTCHHARSPRTQTHTHECTCACTRIHTHDHTMLVCTYNSAICAYVLPCVVHSCCSLFWQFGLCDVAPPGRHASPSQTQGRVT